MKNGPFPRKFPVYLAVLRSNRPQNRSEEDENQKIKRTFTYRKRRRSFTGPTASPKGANTEFSPSFALQRTVSWRNSRIRSRFPMNPLFPEFLAPGIRSCLVLYIRSQSVAGFVELVICNRIQKVTNVRTEFSSTAA